MGGLRARNTYLRVGFGVSCLVEQHTALFCTRKADWQNGRTRRPQTTHPEMGLSPSANQIVPLAKSRSRGAPDPQRPTLTLQTTTNSLFNNERYDIIRIVYDKEMTPSLPYSSTHTTLTPAAVSLCLISHRPHSLLSIIRVSYASYVHARRAFRFRFLFRFREQPGTSTPT